MRITVYMKDHDRAPEPLRKAFEELTGSRSLISIFIKNRKITFYKDALGFSVDFNSLDEATEVLDETDLRFHVEKVILFEIVPWSTPLTHGTGTHAQCFVEIGPYLLTRRDYQERQEVWAHRLRLRGDSLERVKSIYESLMTYGGPFNPPAVTTPSHSKTYFGGQN